MYAKLLQNNDVMSSIIISAHQDLWLSLIIYGQLSEILVTVNALKTNMNEIALQFYMSYWGVQSWFLK